MQLCFEKALRLEASLQLSEGVNMAWKTAVMNVDVDVEDEINIVRDVRARSNACYKCGEMGHFQRIASMMVISHLKIDQIKILVLIPKIQ